MKQSRKTEVDAALDLTSKLWANQFDKEILESINKKHFDLLVDKLIDNIQKQLFKDLDDILHKTTNKFPERVYIGKDYTIKDLPKICEKPRRSGRGGCQKRYS